MKHLISIGRIREEVDTNPDIPEEQALKQGKIAVGRPWEDQIPSLASKISKAGFKNTVEQEKLV